MSDNRLSSLSTRLLTGAAFTAIYTVTLSSAVYAQSVEITDDRTTTVTTATVDGGSAATDLTVTSTGTVTVTSGPAITLDSDTELTFDGDISIEDTDDVTGIEVQTGNTGFLINTGSIALTEDYIREDSNSDGIVEGDFAIGTGRTGILISGASAFTGDFTSDSTSAIGVEGNDSAAIRLQDTASIIGDIALDSSIAVVGTNAVGVDLLGDVDGDISIDGSVATTGESAQAINIAGDTTGAVVLSGTVSNTGYTISTRISSEFRDLLLDDNVLQAGSAVNISGNVDGGIYLSQITSDDDVLLSIPSITQNGSAPAFTISGGDDVSDTQIAVGLISAPTDDDAAATLDYGFVNEGTITANGVIDDVSATGVYISNADIAGGISNALTISTTTYRSGITDAATNDAADLSHAYGVRLGDGAVAAVFDNSGTIQASANEAADAVFADSDNPLDANDINATAIDIASGASVTEFTNTGIVRASISGRQGTAIALVDKSGELITINNQAFILASGATSDPDALSTDAAPEFTLIAIDVSANTSGVTLTQSLDSTTSTVSPFIIGDILLGSGADTVDLQAGFVSGDISFGDGADVLMLDSSTLTGSVTDGDADLQIALTNSSTLLLNEAAPLNLTDASFDGTSTLVSYIDVNATGAQSNASVINASGTVSFAEGAQVTPFLNDVINLSSLDADRSASYTVVDAGTLTLGTDGVAGLQPTTSPHLFNVSYELGNGGNSLDAVVKLRPTSELGLDEVQIGASDNVFDAFYGALEGSEDFGSAFAAITDEAEFVSAYNQVLPELSGAVGRFVSANVDGATGTVASHLNNARLSDEKPGGVWIEEFGYYADRELEGLSEAYRGFGFGFSGGIDSAWGPLHTVGLNFGFSATEVEDVLGIDDPLAVQTLQTGIYGGYERGNFGLDGYLGGGYNYIESRRAVEIGSYSGTATGEWSGFHYNGALNAGYDIALGEKFFMRPVVGVNYMSLSEQSYIEDGADAIRLAIADRKSDIGSVSAMLNFGGEWTNDKVWWRPSARIGVKNDFSGSGVITEAAYASTGGVFSIVSRELPPSAVIFGVSFTMGSRYSSFGFDYDADMRDGYSLHTARLILRMLF